MKADIANILRFKGIGGNCVNWAIGKFNSVGTPPSRAMKWCGVQELLLLIEQENAPRTPKEAAEDLEDMADDDLDGLTIFVADPDASTPRTPSAGMPR